MVGKWVWNGRAAQKEQGKKSWRIERLEAYPSLIDNPETVTGTLR